MSDESPYNARLIERYDFNPELAAFKVAYDDGSEIDFEPGQFTTLGLIDPDAAPNPRRKGPKLIRRAYSIASSPKVKDHIEFFIVRVDEGALTPKLWQMNVGDPIFMDAKFKGHFSLDGVPDGKDLVLVSTGTGLAPYLSMLKTYQHTGRWNKLVILHGCRVAIDLGYRDELEKIAAEDDSVIYLPMCTREPEDSDWKGLRGRVPIALDPEMYKELTGSELTPEQCHVFLCGNPAMIDQCQGELEQRGWKTKGREHPDGNLHFERYW
ncbi:ferredoxin--NADP reductase [Mucisphaera calidilacus]|uniref:ferredoxin--NADP(+) reductase n=1 Tax=Mucisphaera calidilacus TaxID=2527982 RepID=A0A518BTR7_9BACT|nr:ferredoxin--NADP reductase [Mucisphaera calidilacus]QDU70366.1 Ferredoxin--NADP reductase [Mucisphaera calidilacus]